MQRDQHWERGTPFRVRQDNTSVATSERADSRASPQTPAAGTPAVEPRAKVDEKAAKTTTTGGRASTVTTGSAPCAKPTDSGPAIKPRTNATPPDDLTAVEPKKATDNDGDAGDAAWKKHQHNRVEADKKLAEESGDRREVLHLIRNNNSCQFQIKII